MGAKMGTPRERQGNGISALVRGHSGRVLDPNQAGRIMATLVMLVLIGLYVLCWLTYPEGEGDDF